MGCGFRKASMMNQGQRSSTGSASEKAEQESISRMSDGDFPNVHFASLSVLNRGHNWPSKVCLRLRNSNGFQACWMGVFPMFTFVRVPAAQPFKEGPSPFYALSVK